MHERCFGCGQENERGLKLKVNYIDGDNATAEFTTDESLRSHDGILHGGIICTILDTVMANMVSNKINVRAFTAKFEVRFRNPITTNEKIYVFCNISKSYGSIIEAEGKIKNESGIIAVSAKGWFAREKISNGMKDSKNC
ncbi:MAG: PaaI family thioesterase [Candidatus Wallbacteria bacterium]